MTLTIKIDMDGAAFKDCVNGMVMARILRWLAGWSADMFFLTVGTTKTILDDNGNTVGRLTIR